ADLVFISWADAAAGRADLALARCRLAQRVEIAVEREDERAIVRHREIGACHLDALTFQLLDFGLERPGIEHHAIADDGERPGDDARGHEADLVGLIAHHQRMPGIVPTLKAHHAVRPARQPVDDLAFAFIAPLGANHGYVCHGYR